MWIVCGELRGSSYFTSYIKTLYTNIYRKLSYLLGIKNKYKTMHVIQHIKTSVVMFQFLSCFLSLESTTYQNFNNTFCAADATNCM